MVTDNISKNIKNLRVQNNLKQNDLAEKLGISRQALSNYENSTRVPDLFTIIRLAKVFNITIDQLIFSNLYESPCISQFDKIRSDIIHFLKNKKIELEDINLSILNDIEELNKLINLLENEKKR
ncbi:MAG: helix-turn-helix transcriptional regulator [Cetobacterium sp.]|uniref:helix-turn-helix domain-containing protein n=1 Tax=Bacteria TaxID=2 RepID=UPI002FC7D1C8